LAASFAKPFPSKLSASSAPNRATASMPGGLNSRGRGPRQFTLRGGQISVIARSYQPGAMKSVSTKMLARKRLSRPGFHETRGQINVSVNTRMAQLLRSQPSTGEQIRSPSSPTGSIFAVPDGGPPYGAPYVK
jgi:hypothetical protein